MSLIVILEAKIEPELVASTEAFLNKSLPDTRDYEGCAGLHVYENLDETGNLIA